METKEIVKRTIIISGIIIIIDQLLKFIAIKFCSNTSIEIIPGILSITQIENTGIAFGLNEGNLKNIVITSVIILFMIRYLFTQKKFINTITLTTVDFIIAGGISNIIDRIFRGGVIDFIQISNFPIFNLADICIVVGCILFAFYIIKFDIKTK